MSEFRKAFFIALASVVLLCLWLSQELRVMRTHTWILLHGPVLAHSRITNVEALGMELMGLFLVIFMLAILGLRRVTYRESGGMLAHGQREIPDLRGMETFKKRLE